MNLREALEAVQPAIGKGDLGLVRIESGRDRTTVRACNGEVDIIAHAELDFPSLRAWQASVSHRDLLRVVRGCPERIDLDPRGSSLWISSGGHATMLPAAADEPGLQPVGRASSLWSVTVDAAQLARALDVASVALFREDSRVGLCGAALAVVDGELWITTTDGHRLAHARVPIADGADAVIGPDALLAPPVVDALRKILPSEGSVTLWGSDSWMGMDSPHLQLAGRCTEGPFPDWQAVFPGGEQGLREARLGSPGAGLANMIDSLPVQAVSAALRRHAVALAAAAALGHGSSASRLAWSATALTLSSRGGQVVQTDTVDIDAPQMDGAKDIGVARALLADALAAVGADTAWLGYAQPLAPLALLPAADPDDGVWWAQIVMPMRLD